MTPDEDHDQRFKALIREFFADFLRLFFADWAARFDLSGVEWLDGELFPEPPGGGRHLLDLVARLRTAGPVDPGAGPDPPALLALVHIEIEAPDRTTRLKPRLPAYYVHLRERHGCPVLPIVLYLRVGLNGLGTDDVVESFWELDVLRFRYLYVGLPGLDAEAYLTGGNWLGVALSALMRIPPDRVAWLGAEALRRLSAAPLSDQQRFLLGECVQAYLPLDDAQRAVYDSIMRGTEYSGVQAVNKTVYQQGRDEGRLMGQVDLIVALLESRFGGVPADLPERLRLRPPADLRTLAVAIPSAESLAALGL